MITVLLTANEAAAVREVIGKTKPDDYAKELNPMYKEMSDMPSERLSVIRSQDWKCPSEVPDVV